MVKIKTHNLLSKLGRINDEQFKVLYFIYNSIAMNADERGYAKIYRAVLADLTGKSERTISRITDKLEKLGLIVKHNVSDGDKLYNYYAIPRQETESKTVTGDTKQDQFLVTGDRVKEEKNLKIERKKELKIERLEEDVEKAKDYINQELVNVNDFVKLSTIGTVLRNYVRDNCKIPGLEDYLNSKIKEKAEDIRNSNENDVRLCEASLPSR